MLSFVDPDQDVALGQAVTETDVNAQYLAGLAAELGDGEPTEHGPIPVDDQPATFKLPGYVQLGSKPDLAQLPPMPGWRSPAWTPAGGCRPRRPGTCSTTTRPHSTSPRPGCGRRAS